MTTTKAIIADVKFASDLTIECLMLPDGSFGIAAVQVMEVLGLQPVNGNSSRDLKALLGKGFQPVKIATELNPNKAVVITLEQFALVCIQMVKRGNTVAERLLQIHAGASFTSVVSSAFGVKFSQEELVQWVECRDVHKKTFPLMTRWFHLDGVTNYGLEVNRFKRAAGLPIKAVDLYSKYELFEANASERTYDKMRTRGLSHTETLALV